jgi:hypothetical protein
VLQALSVMWVAGQAQDLQEKANLIAAIGIIWQHVGNFYFLLRSLDPDGSSKLHIDLLRIVDWLSQRFVGGEWQGLKHPEVKCTGISVEYMILKER